MTIRARMVPEGSVEQGMSAGGLDAGGDVRLVALSCVLAVASYFGRWASGELGGRSFVVHGTDLVVAPVIVGTLLVAALIIASTLRSVVGQVIVATIGIVVAMVGVAAIYLVETVASFVPDDVLPVTLRRISVGLAADEGVWGLVACGLMVTLAASGRTKGLRMDRTTMREAARLSADRWPMLLVLGGALILGLSRYAPWVEASAPAYSYGAEGWRVPYVGVVSLLGVWALLVAGVLLAVRPGHLGLLPPLAIAWAASAASAILIVLSGAAGHLHLAAIGSWFGGLPRWVVDLDPQVSTGPGARWAFAGAVVGCTGIVCSLWGSGAEGSEA